MKKIIQAGPQLEVEFPYDPGLVNLMHQLRGRYRNQNNRKWWIVDNSVANLQTLLSHQFVPETTSIAPVSNLPTAGGTSKKIKRLDGWKIQPMAFQLAGISFAEQTKGRCLIADEQGLGKTLQAIGYMWLHKEEGLVVIVCPATLKENWKREIIKWTGVSGKRIEIAQGRTPSKKRKISPWIIIINYDILLGWVDTLAKMKPRLLVLDEIHYIKTRAFRASKNDPTKGTGSKRTKAVTELAKHCQGVIGLSGTPVLNRPIELFNTLKLLKPDLFPSFFRYASRYCDAHHNGFGWEYNGASNVEELRTILTQDVMIRRLKSEVLTELPSKSRSVIPLDIDNRKEYELACDDFAAWLENRDQGGVDCALAQIEALKQICAKGKMKLAVQWVRDFLESGEKLVLFAHHKTIIAELTKHFQNECVVLDGNTPPDKRQWVVEQFQNKDNCRLFIGNLKAAGVGITLTAASNVAFLEIPWTPAELDQAEDRCHRIGQKDAVNCWYLLGKNTIEEDIMKILDQKRKVIDSVIDGRVTDKGHLLTELFKVMKDRQ